MNSEIALYESLKTARNGKERVVREHYKFELCLYHQFTIIN